MQLYSLSACENIINKYVERGGEVYTIEEGTLGLGLMVLTGHDLKTTIIQEVYILTNGAAGTRCVCTTSVRKSIKK